MTTESPAVVDLQAQQQVHEPLLVIDAHKAEQQYWRDLWAYRELAAFLAWRDILVRYKQTAMGIAWAVVRPLLLMLVGTFIFEKVLRQPSVGDVPYAILVYCGVLPWQFFGDSLTASSNSLVANANMISKIYFPRLLLPLSKLVVSCVDFVLSFCVLGLLMAWYGFAPSANIVFLPLFVLLGAATAFAAGQILAALNVKYRDVMYVVPFIVQFGAYMSSVFFSSDRIPEQYRAIYSLNPMVSVIDGFRWCVLGPVSSLYWPGIVSAVLVVVALLIGGAVYFRKTERTFADVI